MVTRRLLLACFLLAGLLPGVARPQVDQTALDRYVAKPDPAYKHDLVKTIPGTGYTAFVIDLTSQTWRTAAEVDRTVWKHWLTVVVPEGVRSTTGFLFIGGGSVKSAAPDKPDAAVVEAALATHSVAAGLSGIPNEPLTFRGETKSRNEDEIIAYSWAKFLKTGDETWPLRLPMTKAVVRAMDTVTAFCATQAGGGAKVEKFFVAGGSKRGWTTWTTAAVDKRIVGISPIVIDVLNMSKSMDHHFQAYGAYSEAVKDYVDMGLMGLPDTKEFRELMRIEEPYSYRTRFTMPKLVMNSTGDQYFLPDSSQFYFDDLPGEKYLRYVPNTNHSLGGSDAMQSVVAFYGAVLNGQPRPKFTWTFEKNGDIRVVSADKPTEVKLWVAVNPDKRDFRLMTIGPAYKSTSVAEQPGGVFVGHVDKPAKGWAAYFLEMTYASGGKYPFKFTTAVRVAPDTLPFPPPPHNAKVVELP
jgi:PhoPQ-activated pathogenicity-related protein